MELYKHIKQQDLSP